jgi:hypothetical protein
MTNMNRKFPTTSTAQQAGIPAPMHTFVPILAPNVCSFVESRVPVPEAGSKGKHGVWDPIPELTKTSPYVPSREDFNTFIMGNHMPKSTLSPSQGLRIWLLGRYEV